MAASSDDPDRTWSDLADLDEAARESAMRERFLTLLVLAPEERRDALRRMILAEYRLGPLRLVPFIHSRLGVWLTLNGDAAGTLADDYAALTRELPELVAERRSSADALAWRRLSPDQRAALQTRLPAVTAQMQPQPTAGAFETAAYRRDEVATVASAGAREAAAPQPGAPTRRRWRAVARVVELSNRMTARVWDAQLLLVERLRLFWNRACARRALSPTTLRAGSSSHCRSKAGTPPASSRAGSSSRCRARPGPPRAGSPARSSSRCRFKAGTPPDGSRAGCS